MTTEPIVTEDHLRRACVLCGENYEAFISGRLSTRYADNVRTVARLLAERDAMQVRVEGRDETAWLIEMIHNDAPSPRYWNPAPNKGWVWDHNEAIRFAREQDARNYLAGSRCLGGKPVEHVWTTLTEPNPMTDPKEIAEYEAVWFDARDAAFQWSIKSNDQAAATVIREFVEAKLAEGRVERDEALQSAEAMSEKLDALVYSLKPAAETGGYPSCGCSYDTPSDVCLHHSPQLVKSQRTIAEQAALIEKLREALPFVEEAIHALGIEMYQGTAPSDMERVEGPSATIAINLDRVDCAIGPAGSSMFASIAEDIRQTVIALHAARAALKEGSPHV